MRKYIFIANDRLLSLICFFFDYILFVFLIIYPIASLLYLLKSVYFNCLSKCLVLKIVWFRVGLMINLTSDNKRAFEFSQHILLGKIISFSHHESNLSLTAREFMWLLVNDQLIPYPILSKITFLEQSYYERSQAIVATLIYCCLC